MFATNPPGRNRHIAVAQATEHFSLVTPGHEPKYPSGAIEHRIRQCHPAPALVDSSQRDVRVSHVQNRIARHQ